MLTFLLMCDNITKYVDVKVYRLLVLVKVCYIIVPLHTEIIMAI